MSDDKEGRAMGRSRGRARTTDEIKARIAAMRPGEGDVGSIGRGRGVTSSKPAPEAATGRAYHRWKGWTF